VSAPSDTADEAVVADTVGADAEDAGADAVTVAGPVSTGGFTDPVQPASKRITAAPIPALRTRWVHRSGATGQQENHRCADSGPANAGGPHRHVPAACCGLRGHRGQHGGRPAGRDPDASGTPLRNAGHRARELQNRSGINDPC